MIGLHRWTESEGWVKLSPLNAEHFAIAPDGPTVVADFGSRGLKRWTPAGWVALSKANVLDAIISSDGDMVVADFGVGGLRVYDSGWTTLSGLDPEQMLLG